VSPPPNHTPPFVLRKVWGGENDEFKDHMPWTVLCMCFFGFLPTGKALIPSQKGYDHQYIRAYRGCKSGQQKETNLLKMNPKASKTDVLQKRYTWEQQDNLCSMVATVTIYFSTGME